MRKPHIKRHPRLGWTVTQKWWTAHGKTVREAWQAWLKLVSGVMEPHG